MKGIEIFEAEEYVLMALRATMNTFMSENFDRLCTYEDIIVAYDKGQLQLSKLISDMFRQRFPRVQLTRTLPIYSRIFQVADFVRTLRRIALRFEREGELAKVEGKFFGSVANFKKNWFYPMLKSEWR